MMRSKEIIELITVSYVTDSLGNQKKVENKRKVYANEKSVGINEFYDAGTNGFKPERTFSIHTFEYANEDTLLHNGVEYKIIRAASRGESTDLVCERNVSNGN